MLRQVKFKTNLTKKREERLGKLYKMLIKEGNQFRLQVSFKRLYA